MTAIGPIVLATHLPCESETIFEAGFEAGGARAFVDILLPVRKRGQKAWRMMEVKSSASAKDYHRDDAACTGAENKQSARAIAGSSHR